MKSKSPWTQNVALKMCLIFSMFWLCISDINFYNLHMDLLKICWLTFYPSCPHFLPLSHYILPSSPNLASTIFPLLLPHLLRLYKPCIVPAWANVSTPPSLHSSPIQSSTATGSSREEVRRVMGLSNSPTQWQVLLLNTTWVCYSILVFVHLRGPLS